MRFMSIVRKMLQGGFDFTLEIKSTGFVRVWFGKNGRRVAQATVEKKGVDDVDDYVEQAAGLAMDVQEAAPNPQNVRTAICRICNRTKVRRRSATGREHRRSDVRYRFYDEAGRPWNGRMCPQCHSGYQRLNGERGFSNVH